MTLSIFRVGRRRPARITEAKRFAATGLWSVDFFTAGTAHSAVATAAMGRLNCANEEARPPVLPRHLHRDWRFDGGMRVVTDEFEIFELEAVNVFDGRVQFHLGQRSIIARKLLARLLEMIVVDMQV